MMIPVREKANKMIAALGAAMPEWPTLDTEDTNVL